MPRVSLILRLKNQEQFLPAVLEALAGQTEKDFEIIAVDDNSTDKTSQILKDWEGRLDIKIFSLPGEFTYPKACNFGAQKATGEMIGYLSGHSVPVFPDFLEKGLRHFENPKVAGVYGPVLPLSNASIWERLYYTGGIGEKGAFQKISRQQPVSYDQPRLGLLGNTNSLLRRDLWAKRPFNETMVIGGEDTEWAGYWLKQGYVVVKEPHLAIRHSHGVGLWALIKQYRGWQKMYRRGLA